jgi:hypothetical protein
VIDDRAERVPSISQSIGMERLDLDRQAINPRDANGVPRWNPREAGAARQISP